MESLAAKWFGHTSELNNLHTQVEHFYFKGLYICIQVSSCFGTHLMEANFRDPYFGAYVFGTYLLGPIFRDLSFWTYLLRPISWDLFLGTYYSGGQVRNSGPNFWITKNRSDLKNRSKDRSDLKNRSGLFSGL